MASVDLKGILFYDEDTIGAAQLLREWLDSAGISYVERFAETSLDVADNRNLFRITKYPALLVCETRTADTGTLSYYYMGSNSVTLGSGAGKPKPCRFVGRFQGECATPAAATNFLENDWESRQNTFFADPCKPPPAENGELSGGFRLDEKGFIWIAAIVGLIVVIILTYQLLK